MNRVRSLYAMAALVSAASAYANEVTPNGLNDIVIADELRTAFYERAPPALVAALSRAVSSC